MKYYLDENLSPKVAEILVKHRLDALSAHQVGMMKVPDWMQLEFAAAHKRVMVIRDRDDFIVLTLQFFNEQRSHCGLLVIPHTFPRHFLAVANALIKYTAHNPHGMSAYQIDYLKK